MFRVEELRFRFRMGVLVQGLGLRVKGVGFSVYAALQLCERHFGKLSN